MGAAAPEGVSRPARLERSTTVRSRAHRACAPGSRARRMRGQRRQDPLDAGKTPFGVSTATPGRSIADTSRSGSGTLRLAPEPPHHEATQPPVGGPGSAATLDHRAVYTPQVTAMRQIQYVSVEAPPPPARRGVEPTRSAGRRARTGHADHHPGATPNRARRGMWISRGSKIARPSGASFFSSARTRPCSSHALRDITQSLWGKLLRTSGPIPYASSQRRSSNTPVKCAAPTSRTTSSMSRCFPAPLLRQFRPVTAAHGPGSRPLATAATLPLARGKAAVTMRQHSRGTGVLRHGRRRATKHLPSFATVRRWVRRGVEN